jgi:hypothetical protein
MSQLDQLDARDVDQLVKRARLALASHVREMATSPAPANLLAAIDTTIGPLRELARAHPGKREQIEVLIARYASRS